MRMRCTRVLVGPVRVRRHPRRLRRGGRRGASVPTERKAAVAERYADLVHAAYGASVAGAEQMRERIDAFLDAPDAGTAGARAHGLDRRPRRLRRHRAVSLLRRADRRPRRPGPRASSTPGRWTRPTSTTSRTTRSAGIVNDRAAYPKITEDVIVEANEKGGETNISTGWHAIEFLLWGQDRSKDGPGARPATDYTTAPNAERRADLPAPDDRRLRQRPAQRAARVGARRRRVPRGVPRRSRGGADEHLPRHRRAQLARARRRADGRRVRDQGPGGRALLLQRQHQRRRRQRPDAASAMVYNGEAARRRRRDRASLASLLARGRSGAGAATCGQALDAIAGQGAGVPGHVRDDDRRARRVAGQRRRSSRRSRRSRRRATLLKQAAEALDVKVSFEG